MDKPAILNSIPTKERAIAFTFDDGPNPDFTLQLLDIFAGVGGRATFFVIGEQIDKSLETALKAFAAGHELANHSQSHPHLSELSPEAVRSELAETDRRIRALTGRPVRSFRPPYLEENEPVLAIAAEFGYRSIGAVNRGTRDWELPGVDHILAETRGHIGGGSILLFHDGFGDRSQTIEAVRTLVAELAAEGYRFVTVSELLELADEI